MDALTGVNAPWPPFLQNDYVRNLTFSVALIAVLMLICCIVNRLVTPRMASAEERRRWLSGSRNTIALLLVFGLAAVWANAIHSFVISIIALAAAMVIAPRNPSFA